MANRLLGLFALTFLQVGFVLYSNRRLSFHHNQERDGVSIPVSSFAPKRPRGVVAYAISFTQCPKTGSAEVGSADVLDAPAVLAHSIHLNSYRHMPEESNYDYHLIAFVHPTAINCTQYIEQFGYEVQIRPEPVTLKDVENERYRRLVQGNGCCSIREFMKLYSYALTQYEVAVHLDADVIILKPMDELYDAMLSNNASQVATLHLHPDDAKGEAVDFFFTRDYIQESSMSKDTSKYGVQGGFFLVRPNLEIFELMKAVIRKGEYGRFMGWGQKHYGGYYGAPQIQGFLSYFYGEIHRHGAIELHPCVYSTLQTLPHLSQDGSCRFGLVNPCPDCTATNLSDIKMTHFTSCYKPWFCPKARMMQLCRDLHAEWFRLRRSFERSRGLEIAGESGFLYDRFYGYCTDFKREHYVPMNLMKQNIAASI